MKNSKFTKILNNIFEEQNAFIESLKNKNNILLEDNFFSNFVKAVSDPVNGLGKSAIGITKGNWK